MKPTHRLTEKHINVSGTQRMNVRKAVQLLSETTSKALDYYGGQGLLKSKHWESERDFIKKTDLYYDLFNSRVPFDRKPSRNAYGVQLEEQNKRLYDMEHTAETMRVCKSNKMYQFQKGIIVSCQSLPRLYNMLKSKYNVSYIITSRLNQDGLENMFGCIRQMGVTYDHPTPVEVGNRVKTFLIGKKTSITGNNCNSMKECDSPNISEGMFNKDKSSVNNESNENELEKELMISAMVFAATEDEKIQQEESEDLNLEFQEKTLETVADEEGLRYVGGYVASKFPEYQFLGCKLKKENGTWISAVERHQDESTKLSPKFF